jgi:D-proline reductase (dithiol) PrdB
LKSGIPCISTTVVPYITYHSKVSRSVYIRFPQGTPLGEPNNPEQQRQILGSILDAYEAIDEPGTMVQLPYRWRRFSAEPIDESKCEGYRVTTEGMEEVRARYLDLLETCERYEERLNEVIDRVSKDKSLPFAYERLLRRDAARNHELIARLESEVGDRITMTSRRSFLIQLAWEGKKV